MPEYVVTAHLLDDRIGYQKIEWGPFSSREAAEQCVIALGSRSDVAQCLITPIKPKKPDLGQEAEAFLRNS